MTSTALGQTMLRAEKCFADHRSPQNRTEEERRRPVARESPVTARHGRSSESVFTWSCRVGSVDSSHRHILGSVVRVVERHLRVSQQVPSAATAWVAHGGGERGLAPGGSASALGIDLAAGCLSPFSGHPRGRFGAKGDRHLRCAAEPVPVDSSALCATRAVSALVRQNWSAQSLLLSDIEGGGRSTTRSASGQQGEFVKADSFHSGGVTVLLGDGRVPFIKHAPAPPPEGASAPEPERGGQRGQRLTRAASGSSFSERPPRRPRQPRPQKSAQSASKVLGGGFPPAPPSGSIQVRRGAAVSSPGS